MAFSESCVLGVEEGMGEVEVKNTKKEVEENMYNIETENTIVMLCNSRFLKIIAGFFII